MTIEHPNSIISKPSLFEIVGLATIFNGIRNFLETKS